jgi:regulator of sigma E protease
MVSLLSFLLVIAICVISHEYGHYKTARLAGVQVHEFAFGMGPVIWQRKGKDGTVWSWRIFPVGGFVRLAGMDEEKPGEKVAPGGAFYDKSATRRFLILLNGALANILLAILLTGIFLWGHGILDLSSTRIGEIMGGYPAEVAGISVGDQVLSVNDSSVANWQEMSEAIRSYAEKGPVTITISRNGNILPFSVPIPVDPEFGVPLLGVRPVFKSFGPVAAFTNAFNYIFRMSSEWIRGIFLLLTNRSQVDLTGPVGIASMAGEAVKGGLWSFLSFLAVINLNLGMINLFPFPGLDGGRLVFVFLEIITRKKVPEHIENYIHLAGFFLLIALIMFITWKDILKLFG